MYINPRRVFVAIYIDHMHKDRGGIDPFIGDFATASPGMIIDHGIQIIINCKEMDIRIV
jgi:hypothetical protein